MKNKQLLRTKEFSKGRLILMGLLVLVIIITGSMFYYNYQSSEITREKYEELEAIAELKIDQLVQWRNERISDIKVIAHSAIFIDLVNEWVNNKQNTVLKNSLLSRLELVKKSYKYNDVLIIGINGEILFSVDMELKSIENSQIYIPQNIVDKSIKTREVEFSDLYICPLSHDIHLDLSIPIISRENKIIAVLLYRIEPQEYLYPLIQKWPMPSNSAETLIFEQEEDSVVFLNELRHTKNSAIKLKYSLTQKEIPAVQAVLGKRGITEGLDYRFVDVIAYISNIPQTPWYMISKVDKSEIFSELNFRVAAIIIFALLMMFATFGGLAFIYSSRQKNTFKELFEQEKLLRDTEEKFKTILYSIGDAVITTDKDGRVQQLNEVAEQLTGWMESEAKGKNLDVIFNIVNQETREKVENPVQKVLEAGSIIGLANHTLLLSRDGAEFMIADSGAPIRNEEGEITGMVLVFRDQTLEYKSQKSLEESEIKFRSVFENSPLGKSMTGLDGTLNINKAFCDILGYTEDELKSKNWKEITDPSDIKKSEEVVTSLIEGEISTAVYEKRYIHKSGKIIWTNVNTALHRDQSDNPLFFITTIQDITESKLAEAKLIESENKFKNLFNSVSIPLCYVKADGSFDSINNRFTELLGYTLDDVPNLDVWWVTAYPDEEYREKVMDNWSKSVQKSIDKGLDIKSNTYNVTCKNGDLKEIIISGITVGDDVLATFVDVTELKKTEREIIKEKEFSESVINSLPGIFYLFDQSGKFLKWNTTLADLSGKPFDEVGKMSLLDFIAPHHREKIQTAINTAFTKGKIYVEADFLSFGQEPIPFYFTGSRIELNGKSLLVGVGLDISKRKDAELRLNKIMKDLKRSNEELEQFAYVASHDLQEPLRMVSSYTQLLEKRYKDKLDEDAKDFIHFAVDGANRMQILINDLLQYSRITTRGKEFELADLNAALERCIVNLHTRIIENKAIVTNEELPSVKADGSQITRVFQNIINNALIYKSEECPYIAIASIEHEDKFEIIIKDNGIGISPEFHDRIFEIFERLHSREEYEGTGIGLAICKRIVQRHGGEIWVKSEIGEGSEFHFTLNKN